MSGKKYPDGERERCPINGKGRRLSRENINEIRREIELANSRVKRKGLKPKGSKIAMFSCACNCFAISVE
jgi:hypothetical protein